MYYSILVQFKYGDGQIDYKLWNFFYFNIQHVQFNYIVFIIKTKWMFLEFF